MSTAEKKTHGLPPAGERVSAWSLIKPYWVSEDRRIAFSLVALVIVLNLALVYLNVRYAQWYSAFYDALDKHDLPAFKTQLAVFAGIAFGSIILGTVRIYFRQMLEFRWRQWLTDVYLDRWLSSKAYYRLERDHVVDNPDQRIAEDLRSLASNTLTLSLDLISTVVTLFSFVTMLWVLSGALSFTLLGHGVSIPGYMVWFAVVYAIIGSLVIHKFNWRLIDVGYRQQKVEADFRVLLVRVRENAEQIAFYDGGAPESRRARAAFGAVRQNWREIMRYTKRLTFCTSVYAQIGIIFPVAAAAPRYFAGAFTIGVLMQLMQAFGQVSDSCSWFINSYATLADWRATVNRLREFTTRMNAGENAGLQVVKGGEVAAWDLHVSRPDGQALSVPADFRVRPGERWLMRGPSGSGKSTLLRTLAGLWPHAKGRVTMPAGAGREQAGGLENPRQPEGSPVDGARAALFLPQMSYVPNGTLKAALCYPDVPEQHDDASCASVLRDCRLEAYAGDLDKVDDWAHRLSPGEKQRLSFARALLLKPAYLFMDEATASLDLDTERHLYETLLRRLPRTAIISVAHRDSLERFHTHEMRVGPHASVQPLQPMPAGV